MDNEATIGQVESSEKMLPQSHVNDLIGGAKAAAADKATRETEARVRAEYEDKLKSAGSLDKEALFSEWEQRSQAKMAESKRLSEEAEVEQKYNEIARKYDQKLVASKDISPDFDELMRKFPHKTHQALVIGTADLPNTADVMLYLAKHPSKAFVLNQTASGNWDGFMDELKGISNELQAQKSSGSNKVKAPLPTIKSDVVGLNNSGKRTLNDLRGDKSLRLS